MWTIGSRSAGASGDYWGTFYGTTIGVDDDAAETVTHARNDGTPTSAGGEFSAQFGAVGRMVGAFGVNSMTDDTPSN